MHIGVKDLVLMNKQRSAGSLGCRIIAYDTKCCQKTAEPLGQNFNHCVYVNFPLILLGISVLRIN